MAESESTVNSQRPALDLALQTRSALDQLKRLRQLTTQRGHRFAVLLKGSESWLTGVVSEAVTSNVLSSGDKKTSTLVLAKNAPAGLPRGSAKAILGSELDLLCCELNSVAANDLGIAAGALKAGGLLLCWQTAEPLEPLSGFARHLLNTFNNGEHCLQLNEADLERGTGAPWSSAAIPQSLEADVKPFCPQASPEQLVLIEKVQHVALGHARRPLVVTADRGRGKSSALGLAVQQLFEQVQNRVLTVLVTAPHKTAVVALLEHCPKACWGQHTLRFVAPDQLVAEKPDASLLLVDEAAAIPVKLLEALTVNYSRIVFTTTVHGYEGSGRGFELRFKDRLNALRPQWHEYRLHSPIRWADNDPLEKLIADALLLNADIAELDSVSGENVEFDHICQWRGSDLLATDGDNQNLLQQAFALLVTAHYQTEPSDLQILLSNSSQSLLLGLSNGVVIAACLLADEGSLTLEEASAVFVGTRRLKGHLLPQSLAYHFGQQELLAQRFCRVVRIAVHPDARRKGLGLAMLKAIPQYCEFDYIGASFSFDQDLLTFWQQAGFQFMRMGSKRDTCSGAYSVTVLRAYSEGEQGGVFAAMRQQQAIAFPIELRELFVGLGTEDAVAVLAATQKQELLGADYPEVQRYIDGAIPYEAAYAAIFRFISLFSAGYELKPESSGGSLPAHSLSAYSALVSKVLQGRSWAETATVTDASGRKAVEQLMRQALSEALNNSQWVNNT